MTDSTLSCRNRFARARRWYRALPTRPVIWPASAAGRSHPDRPAIDEADRPASAKSASRKRPPPCRSVSATARRSVAGAAAEVLAGERGDGRRPRLARCREKLIAGEPRPRKRRPRPPTSSPTLFTEDGRPDGRTGHRPATTSATASCRTPRPARTRHPRAHDSPRSCVAHDLAPADTAGLDPDADRRTRPPSSAARPATPRSSRASWAFRASSR